MSALSTGLKFLLTAPEANSRFVFLLHGVVGSIGIMIVAVTYAFPHFPNKDLGPDMILALAGVSGLSAVGRWATKKVGPLSDNSNGPDKS